MEQNRIELNRITIWHQGITEKVKNSTLQVQDGQGKNHSGSPTKGKRPSCAGRHLAEWPSARLSCTGSRRAATGPRHRRRPFMHCHVPAWLSNPGVKPSSYRAEGEDIWLQAKAWEGAQKVERCQPLSCPATCSNARCVAWRRLRGPPKTAHVAASIQWESCTGALGWFQGV